MSGAQLAPEGLGIVIAKLNSNFNNNLLKGFGQCNKKKLDERFLLFKTSNKDLSVNV